MQKVEPTMQIISIPEGERNYAARIRKKERKLT